MTSRAIGQSRVATILLWIVTVMLPLGLGLAGGAKFMSANQWRELFVGWGYPAWFSSVTGIVEVSGAIALLVPRLASCAGSCRIVPDRA